MNIAIFEPEHFETVKALVLLFNPERHTITIYTNETCFKQLSPSHDQRMAKCVWVIKRVRESKYQFLFRFYIQVKRRKTSLLVLNTVNDNFILYAWMVKLLGNIRIILGVHDINAYFRYNRASDFRTWVRNVGKRRLVKYVSEYSVTSTTLAQYLATISPTNKKVHCIPGAVYEPHIPLNAMPRKSNVINLVVAGTIDGRRRDYELVFQLLQKAEAMHLSLSVVLLGTARGTYGKAIIQKCRVYAQTKDNLKFYDALLIDQAEFDIQMELADFVFIPSVIRTVIFDGIEETYGLTKSSGNLADVIKHAKPFIIPRALQVDSFLDKSCIRYNSVEDIVEALVLVRDVPEAYLRIKSLAVEASHSYTIEKVKERNPGLFKSLRSDNQ